MKRFLYVAGIAAIMGHAAHAQEFHVGVSADYAYPHSGDSQTAVSMMGGLTFGDDVLRYGVEAEAGLPLGGNQDYDTARLRLVGFYDFGGYEAMISGGWTRYDFGTDAEDDGTNFGIGVQRDIAARTYFRGEIIRDFLNDSFTAAVTTTRVGVFFRF